MAMRQTTMSARVRVAVGALLAGGLFIAGPTGAVYAAPGSNNGDNGNHGAGNSGQGRGNSGNGNGPDGGGSGGGTANPGNPAGPGTPAVPGAVSRVSGTGGAVVCTALKTVAGLCPADSDVD
jgi:hypothetical protein